MHPRVLFVDDDASTCELMAATLSARGYSPVTASSAEAALSQIATDDVDAVVTDLQMEGIGGIALCERVRQLRPELPVLVLTGHASIDTAVGALRAGAYDFITKPVDIELLAAALGRAVERRRLGAEVLQLRRVVADSARFGEMIGKSDAMLRVFDLVARVADSDTSVLVTGESGTGKELIARAIHQRSPRAAGPFVALNCAAMPPNLIESELFGHAKGAFTDARTARDGLFLQANGGTLFLDEIGEMPLEVQPKLLRALQERTVRPVGGSGGETPFDARLVTATNRDLESDVESGRFREDLLYRIDVVRVDVPPLRMRGRDVLLLAQVFVERFAAHAGRRVSAIDPSAAALLLAYEWPGNVRELENCMERAVTLSRTESLFAADLPAKVRDYQPERVALTGDEPDELPTLEELERRYLAKVLRASGGNKSRAAKTLGLDRRTLYRRLEKHRIAP